MSTRLQMAEIWMRVSAEISDNTLSYRRSEPVPTSEKRRQGTLPHRYAPTDSHGLAGTLDKSVSNVSHKEIARRAWEIHCVRNRLEEARAALAHFSAKHDRLMQEFRQLGLVLDEGTDPRIYLRPGQRIGGDPASGTG